MSVTLEIRMLSIDEEIYDDVITIDKIEVLSNIETGKKKLFYNHPDIGEYYELLQTTDDFILYITSIDLSKYKIIDNITVIDRKQLLNTFNNIIEGNRRILNNHFHVYIYDQLVKTTVEIYQVRCVTIQDTHKTYDIITIDEGDIDHKLRVINIVNDSLTILTNYIGTYIDAVLTIDSRFNVKEIKTISVDSNTVLLNLITERITMFNTIDIITNGRTVSPITMTTLIQYANNQVVSYVKNTIFKNKIRFVFSSNLADKHDVIENEMQTIFDTSQ